VEVLQSLAAQHQHLVADEPDARHDVVLTWLTTRMTAIRLAAVMLIAVSAGGTPVA